MQRMVLTDADDAARWAAGRIADDISRAVQGRGRACVALSGGRSPWVMMAHLFAQPLPWSQVDVLQVDERVAPDGDERRNLTRIQQLLAGTPARAARLHPMPVAGGAEHAVRAYRAVLQQVGGVIDVVQLGLGEDGHTASLAPGDPVLHERHALVAATAQPFNGTVRVTLTYAAINAAADVVWLVTGAAKRHMARRLQEGDHAIPAGRVTAASQVLVLDRAAAG
jgi:6-phosphogluconolactonase